MKLKRIKINDTAYFDTYLLNNSREYNVLLPRPIVIVCPGGGYAFTSDREAEVIALKFNSIGINAVVLWYTTEDHVKNIPENALHEGASCVKYIREHADAWLIDKEKVFVCGFSAGGHLALQMSAKWNSLRLAESLNTTNDMIKINLAIVGYPAVYSSAFPKGELGFRGQTLPNPSTANERFFGTNEVGQRELDNYNVLNFISEKMPPTFVWTTGEDKLVDPEQSLQLALKLHEQKVPFEFYLFEKGEHGLALADRTTARKASHFNSHVSHWFKLCEEWLHPYIDKNIDLEKYNQRFKH